MTTDSPTLKRALEYAGRGWHVFPLAPGTKVPFKGSRGLNDATNEPTAIRRWWLDHPEANVAVRTGACSGLFVLDVDVGDGKRGDESLAELEKSNAPLPTTYTVKTPREGRHYYFLLPSGESVRNSEGTLAHSLDVRGDGGYVVAPPSVFEGRHYQTLNGSPLAAAPAWLFALARSPSPNVTEKHLGNVTECQSIRETEATLLLCTSDTLSLCNIPAGVGVEGVGDMVKLCLPSNVHESHKLLFRLARGVKMLERNQGSAFNDGELAEVFRQWYEQSRSFLRSEQTKDHYMQEFLEAVDSAKLPLDEGGLRSAWLKAQSEPLPEVASKFRSTAARQLVSLCYQLQQAQPGSAFYLSCRNAAALLGITPMRTSRMFKRMVEARVLEVAKLGGPDTNRATRFRYIA